MLKMLQHPEPPQTSLDISVEAECEDVTSNAISLPIPWDIKNVLQKTAPNKKRDFNLCFFQNSEFFVFIMFPTINNLENKSFLTNLKDLLCKHFQLDGSSIVQAWTVGKPDISGIGSAIVQLSSHKERDYVLRNRSRLFGTNITILEDLVEDGYNKNEYSGKHKSTWSSTTSSFVKEFFRMKACRSQHAYAFIRNFKICTHRRGRL